MKLKILILMIVLLLFVPSVQADVVNPSFETGNLTGWSQQAFGAGGSTWISAGGQDGSYYVILHPNSVTGAGIYIHQSVDLTGINTLSYWSASNLINQNAQGVFVNGDYFGTNRTLNTYTWEYFTIDVSSYSGSISVQFWVTEGSGTTHESIYIDNLRLDGVGYDPTYTLSGNVISSSIPIEDASVSVHNDTTNVSITDISNETGYYEITGITSGIWRIQAAAVDYDEWHENDVSITSDTVRDIEMVYNPIPAEAPTTPVIVAIAPRALYGEDTGDGIPDTGEEDGTIIDSIIDFIDVIIDGINEIIDDVIGDDETPDTDEGDESVIRDGIEEIVGNIGDGISNFGEGLESITEPITEPIQSIYEEITHTSETSTFIFIIFAYIGALVASLLLFYSVESEIDTGMILLSGTIGWILLLIITFSGIMNLVFADGLISAFVYGIFGFVIYIVINQLTGEESKIYKS